MKKIFVVTVACLLFSQSPAYSSEPLPDWARKISQKQGDVWLFSGSVHDIANLNVAIHLARNAAFSNIASSIAFLENSDVEHSITGNDSEGYSQNVYINSNHFIDMVAIYGARQREIHVDKIKDEITRKNRFDVYILLEVSDSDLKMARQKYSKRIHYDTEPVYKKPENKQGMIGKIINKVLF